MSTERHGSTQSGLPDRNATNGRRIRLHARVPDLIARGHGLGHIAIGIHAVNTSPPPGQYVLTGSFNFVLRPDGTGDFSVQGGTVENLCNTLA